MGDSDPGVRQRKPQPSNEATEPKEKEVTSPQDQLDSEDAYSPYLDIIRVLSFLFLASCGLSYLVSSGETWFWGMKNPPRYMQLDYWKSQLSGPAYLTLAELAAFDGTDETKPLYLAINGTIYDVSANRRTYGPGGSYHWFAGCDASRAYVTGCFAEDRTGDMRGVEEMFLPLDDPSIDKHFTAEEFERMRAEEMAEAKKRTHEALKHWVDFFAKSKKYHFVGYVKRPEGWPKGEKKRKLCSAASDGRARRKVPGSEG